MEFLKEILGEELFALMKEKIDAFNGAEGNESKQIKIGNLGSGDYVSKGKFEALQELMNGKDTELKSANDLISQMKKATKGNEELQGKIGSYETEVAKLQEELHETKLKSAIKVALLSEKAVDVDYLTYKLNEKMREKGESLELDDNENIKGWEDKLSGLKVQFPNMFEKESKKIIEANHLPSTNEAKDGFTKTDLLKMPYAERNKIFNENPEAYKAAMNS